MSCRKIITTFVILITILAASSRGDTITGSGTANYLPKFTDSYIVGNSVLYESSGNVGIGTTSPTNKLTVGGFVEILSGNDLMLRPTANNFDFRLRAVGTQLNIYAGNDTTNPKMSILDSGNVGIGTTSPSTSLEVNGDIKVVTAAGALNRFFRAEEVGVAGNKAGIAFGGNAVKGAIYGSSGTTGIKIVGANSPVDIGTTSGTDATDISAFTSRLFINSNGNVGIGTTSPQVQLDIRSGGTIYLGYDYAGTSQLLKTFSTAHVSGNVPSQLNIGLADGAFTGILIKNVRDGSYNSQSMEFSTSHGGISTGTRMTIDKDGNVGVGTTVPDQKLDVRGNIVMGRIPYPGNGLGTAWTRFIGMADGAGAASGGGAGMLLNAQTNGDVDVQFQTQQYGVANNNVTIKANGNVGIGTTNPGQKLTVAGTIESTSGGIKFPDGTTQATAASGGGWTDTGTVVKLATSTDNVGIGTDSPSAKLTVKGGNIRIERTDGTTCLELGDGLDYAEGFNVSGATSKIKPGTVLVIDTKNSGKLAVSNQAYDTKVAGIAAGANNLKSGVRLGVGQFDCDVALAGRVYCNVDATQNAVEAGDLLTTSDIKGYAMKAADNARTQGAILGKAMESMEKGKKGQILVLVTLQ
ncbi:MAG TPA: hypothetical protein DDW84_06070 [Phycisphaerales bacterium]|nr:MAG: hypothetical protein A2Y13_00965 [Planctomycetes bacterium GWC2_45_44]HBG78398.1 hypothetical protein [Phycisphaerales bacterium]HBR19763.1 hypothetical protein [Phycisphaerales bacterium]